MPRDISYSDGSTVKNAVVVVWEDLHEERAGFYRAFWADGPEGTCGSPVLGYCQAGGSPGAGRKTDLEAQRTNGGGRTRDLQGVQRHTRAGVSQSQGGIRGAVTRYCTDGGSVQYPCQREGAEDD